MLSRIVTCCKNCQILIRSPLKVDDYLRKKLVDRPSNFHGGFLTCKGRRFREKII